jgi:hypothetical protein
MKTLMRILLFLALILVVDATAAAEAVVLDIDTKGRVALEFDTIPSHARGDWIELTYLAGFLDMLLGS